MVRGGGIDIFIIDEEAEDVVVVCAAELDDLIKEVGILGNAF